MNIKAKYPWLIYLAPVALGIFAIYLPDTWNGFVWDDVHSFFEDPTYRDPAYLHKALSGALIYQENFFRPLPVLTFLVQIHVFELSAAKMHLVSIFLHVTNTFLVMLIAANCLRKYGSSSPVVFTALIGLIYGLHPALIEPVSFISARFDLMTTTFLLLALYLDLRLANQWLRAVGVGFLFLLAALCKEMAVGFAIALPFWHFFLSAEKDFSTRQYLRDIKKRGDIRVYIAIVISGFIYLFLRYQALGLLYDSSLYGNSIKLTSGAHLALIGMSVYKYITLLLFPFGNISVAHPLATHPDLVHYQAVLGYVILFGIAAIAWVASKHRVKILTGYAIVLASLVPILGIVPLPRNLGMYFSETFLPFPAAMLVLVLAQPVTAMVKSGNHLSNNVHRFSQALAAIWLLVSAFTVSITIPVWKSDITLWSWAKVVVPVDIPVRDNLAVAYLKNKQYRRAVDESIYVIKLDKIDDIAWNNLALGNAGMGNFKAAEKAAKKAIALNPEEIQNRITLARVYYASRKYPEAESLLREILRNRPDNLSSYVLLAQVYKMANRPSAAEQSMNQAIDRLPDGQQRKLLLHWVGRLHEKAGPGPQLVQ